MMGDPRNRNRKSEFPNKVYTNEEIAAFDNNFRKQLHFNFLATRMSQKHLESTAATQASRLWDVDLDVLQKHTSILPANWHELSRYILED
jgi:hypothetical protein